VRFRAYREFGIVQADPESLPFLPDMIPRFVAGKLDGCARLEMDDIVPNRSGESRERMSALPFSRRWRRKGRSVLWSHPPQPASRLAADLSKWYKSVAWSGYPALFTPGKRRGVYRSVRWCVAFHSNASFTHAWAISCCAA